MSQQQSVAVKTVQSVERARLELDGFKAHIKHLLQNGSANDLAVVRSLRDHVTQAESCVEKAESTVKRLRQGARVPPRPTASTAPSVLAQRSLSVLRAGLDADGSPPANEKSSAGDAEMNVEGGGRNIRPRIARSSNFPFLSAAGKPAATPVLEEKVNSMLMKLSKEIGLSIGRVGGRTVGFECKNVFRAFVWFKEVDYSQAQKAAGLESSNSVYIAPEHIGCFGTDETNASRWSCSRYAIFQVLSERANAAIRYFTAREKTGDEAFFALAKWLERHKTLFSAKCEERRLAFDASRGIFLPACVYPFEGNGAPRFTRGSIPLRSNSTPPTVRVPGTSHGQGPPPSNPSKPGLANTLSSAPTGQATVNGMGSTSTRPAGPSAPVMPGTSNVPVGAMGDTASRANAAGAAAAVAAASVASSNKERI